MEQIFMLVFMVILIGIVIYFGIKENKETTKENNKIEEDPYRFSKKIRAIKEEYGEFNYIEQPVMKIGEWENEVRKNISSIVDTKTKYSSNKELRILVGDYNRASVSNTTSVLESVGLNVTIANSGIEIIERIKNNEKYDLIISNNIYDSGHCDGPETLMRLREIDNFNIPVIVLTVSKGKRDMFVNGYGFNEYMEKLLTQDKVMETLPKLFKDLEFTKIESNKSTAFLLGGQPGSGKTSLRSAILEETQGNVIVIDNDTFKQQHPNFDELAKLYEKDVVKHVTPYSNRMTEAIISRLSDQGYNLVIEGTGRTTDVPIQTATMLQAKGYETKMYVMAVPKINSYLGTIERYETMYADDPMTARATPKQAHDIVVKNLPTNLETLHKTGLFSDIRLYNREGVKLYSSLETPSISPKETLERELNRKVSGKEIQPTLERIEQKMVQNQHQETPEFKAIQQKLESLQLPTPPIPKTPKLPGL